MTPVTPRAYAFHRSFPKLDREWHEFPYHYLLYASSGTFILEVGTVEWVMPPQRAAWIEALTPISVSAVGPVTSDSVLFEPDFIVPPPGPCRVFSMSILAIEMVRYTVRWGPDRARDDTAADRFFLALANVCSELAQTPRC